MKTALLLLVLWIIYCPALFSQQQNSQWYFGNYALLDFNDGNVPPLSGGDMVSQKCSSKVSFHSTAEVNNLYSFDAIEKNIEIAACQPLPNNLAIKTGDTCNLTVPIQILGQGAFTSWFWNFGDPASGTQDTVSYYDVNSNNGFPFPTHTFSAPGYYTITLIYNETGFPVDTFSQVFAIGLYCNGVIGFADSCAQSFTGFNLLTGAANISSVAWNFGDPASGSNNSASGIAANHTFSTSGMFTISVNVNALCGSFVIDTILEIVDCVQPVCTGSIASTNICLEDSSQFQVNANVAVSNIAWNFGDPSSGLSNTSELTIPKHQFTTPGNYIVTAIVTWPCGIDTLQTIVNLDSCTVSEDCKLFIPNVFTPNNDGVNDFFRAFSNCELGGYSMKIFDRWGSLVFSTTNSDLGWDGTFRGRPSPSDVYVYLIQYQKSNGEVGVKSGSITLLR